MIFLEFLLWPLLHPRSEKVNTKAYGGQHKLIQPAILTLSQDHMTALPIGLKCYTNHRNVN